MVRATANLAGVWCISHSCFCTAAHKQVVYLLLYDAKSDFMSGVQHYMACSRCADVGNAYSTAGQCCLLTRVVTLARPVQPRRVVSCLVYHTQTWAPLQQKRGPVLHA